MTDKEFVTQASYDAAHPSALAVYCSDGRFTRGVEELVAHLGFDRLDTLTIPGGAALLDSASAGHSDVEMIRRATSFLVVGHQIREIVLVSHEGCGYYKARYPRKRPDELRAQQLVDLRAAASWLKAAHAESLAVEMYHARGAAGRIEFLPVD